MNKLSSKQIIIISLFLGLFAWSFDAIIDYLFFYEGTFLGLLLTDIPSHEIFMRLLITLLIITFGLLVANLIAARRRTENQLHESKERFKTIIQNSQAIIFRIDKGGLFTLSEGKMLVSLGLKPGEAVGQSVFELYKDYPVIISGFNKALSGSAHVDSIKLDGSNGDLYFDIFFSPDKDPEDNISGVIGMAIDITERKLMEAEHRKITEKIQQTQQLESLGVLTSGIAHDFNNLLMGILGYADITMMSMPAEAPAYENLEKIAKAAKQASELTQQMLAYTGQGKVNAKLVDLSLLVKDMAHLMEVVINKNASLKYHLNKDLPPIQADSTQLRQIVMNLITNASEAIGEESGLISLSTGVISCDQSYLGSTYIDDQLEEGEYVYLEVSDNGCGMNKEISEKIFDPFYTTKFTGRGLGLAAVMGIVRGHNGAVKIYTEPQSGTTFKVLFPATAETIAERPRTPIPVEWKGEGTILVVDDEPVNRHVSKKMLEVLGFDVLLASDGATAIALFEEHQEKLTLVLLDLIMPGMNGEEVFRKMRNINKQVPVILASGYGEEETVNRFAGKGLAAFLQKPYRLVTLQEKLREILS